VERCTVRNAATAFDEIISESFFGIVLITTLADIRHIGQSPRQTSAADSPYPDYSRFGDSNSQDFNRHSKLVRNVQAQLAAAPGQYNLRSITRVLAEKRSPDSARQPTCQYDINAALSHIGFTNICFAMLEPMTPIEG